METEKRCYSVKELQEMLDVSRQCVYELLKKEEFRWFKIGGKFEQWLKKRKEN